VFPAPFETGKKGAIPEPAVRVLAYWTHPSNTASHVFKYRTFIAILSVFLHRHSSHTSKPEITAKISLHNRSLDLSRAQRRDTRRPQRSSEVRLGISADACAAEVPEHLSFFVRGTVD